MKLKKIYIISIIIFIVISIGVIIWGFMTNWEFTTKKKSYFNVNFIENILNTLENKHSQNSKEILIKFLGNDGFQKLIEEREKLNKAAKAWMINPNHKVAEQTKYNLNHLIQEPAQIVIGPIQDDEALFLYSIIRGNRIKNILEIGGMSGYSAKNFLEAISIFNTGNVYTVDINEVPKMGDRHIVIIKNALDLSAEDINNKLGMIFFDCHDKIQKDVYQLLKKKNLIDDDTIIALHDTNLHPQQILPYIGKNPVIDINGQGWQHQKEERVLANYLKDEGYDIFSIRTKKKDHNAEFPFRHGVTVCQKFKKFIVD